MAAVLPGAGGAAAAAGAVVAAAAAENAAAENDVAAAGSLTNGQPGHFQVSNVALVQWAADVVVVVVGVAAVVVVVAAAAGVPSWRIEAVATASAVAAGKTRVDCQPQEELL